MKKLFTTILTLVAFLTVASVTYAGPPQSRRRADGRRLEFKAALSGAQEVSPPAPVGGVVTEATGSVKVEFDKALTKAEFKLKVFNGVDVIVAHFHCAPAGVNGPVVAFLFPFNPAGVDVNGTLASGTLTNADIIATSGDPCGVTINNIASLAAAMLDGKIYANAHTIAHPAGEIRGQILVSGGPD